jgi:DNA invertase Pin-like site-specific DNA recombinase
MPRGRKPKSELAKVVDQFRKSLDVLLSALEKEQRKTAVKPYQTAKSAKRKYRKRRADKPQKSEPAYVIYDILSKSGKPMSVEVLAKKAGKSVQSIRLYLSKYKCFVNVWGQGYKVA